MCDADANTQQSATRDSLLTQSPSQQVDAVPDVADMPPVAIPAVKVGPTYRSANPRTRVRAKLQHVHPHQLPPDWLDRLNRQLALNHKMCIVNACLREGCIEVHVDMRQDTSAGSNGNAHAPLLDDAAAARAVSRMMLDMLPEGNEDALSDAAGELLGSYPTVSGGPPVPPPKLTQIMPYVIELPCSYFSPSTPTISFTVSGSHLQAPNTQFHVTCQGRHMPVTVTGSTEHNVMLCCPVVALPHRPGMIQVTARTAAGASNSCAVLVVPTAGMVTELQPLLAVLQAVATSRRKTVSQVAINWCMCKGTVPIPGAKSLAQVEENLGSLGWRLASGEVAELDAAAARLKKGMVQNIFQTS